MFSTIQLSKDLKSGVDSDITLNTSVRVLTEIRICSVGEDINTELAAAEVLVSFRTQRVDAKRKNDKAAEYHQSALVGEKPDAKDAAVHEYDVLEFLALLSAHIPKPYESLTRYYGHYSCRARGERRKRLPAAEGHDKGQPSATWAQCIKRIDPLECPRCKEQMRVVAFIQDVQAIKDIMKSQGLPDFRAPPKILVSESIYQDF